MSTLKIFSVFDNAAKAYMRPFFVPTRGMALRGFMDQVSDPQTELNKHASDYTLFELGEFDEQSAQISQHKTPQKVAAAHELLTRTEPETNAA